MKTLITLISITLFLMQIIYSQEIKIDSLKKGEIYKFQFKNNDCRIGKISDMDSIHIRLIISDRTIPSYNKNMIISVSIPDKYEYKKYKTDYKNYTRENYIPEEEIETADTTVKKMNSTLSLSGGIGLTSFLSINDNKAGLPKSYVLNFEARAYLSRKTAIRFFIDYNNLGKDEYYGYSNSSGVTRSMMVITFDVLTGSLKPEIKTKQYFIGGAGAILLMESSATEIYTNPYNGETYEMQQHGENITLPILKLGYGVEHKVSSKTSIGGEIQWFTPIPALWIGFLSFKADVNFKVSKKLGLFFEPQFSLPVAIGDFGEIGEGYLTIKSGLSLTF